MSPKLAPESISNREAIIQSITMTNSTLCFLPPSTFITSYNGLSKTCSYHHTRCRRNSIQRFDSFKPFACSQQDQKDTEPTADQKEQTRFSLNSLSDRMKEVKNKYHLVAKEVEKLESSEEGFVLGSDLSTYEIGRSSIIQDLPLPTTSSFFDLNPSQTLKKVDSFLKSENLSSNVRTDLLKDCKTRLALLRSNILQITDIAHEIVSNPSQKDSHLDGKAGDIIIMLLEMANFSVLPELRTVDNPPSSETLPLGQSFKETLDPALLSNSKKFLTYLKKTDDRMASFYPYLFIATRGVSVSRNSGVLFLQKLGAIERALYSVLSTPLSMFFKSQRYVFKSLFPESKHHENVMPSGAGKHKENHEEKDRRVRRVIPTLKFDEGIKSLSSLFLPSFAQEPTHELLFMMYREVNVDKNRLRKMKQEALLEQIKDSLTQALNPTPLPKSSEGTKKKDKFEKVEELLQTPPGELQHISLQIFKDIEWGSVLHYMPSIYLLPATRDLLKVDALTFTGLLSAATEFFVRRHTNSFLLYASVIASIVSYAGRIALSWRRVRKSYQGNISLQKATNSVSQGEKSLIFLAALAIEEMFVKECCRILAESSDTDYGYEELQQRIFGAVSSDQVCLDDLEQWLNVLEEA